MYGKFVKVLLIANLCFWIYFVISFAQASYPFKRDPWGHPAGAGYTFLGHSIGVVESPFAHPFYQGNPGKPGTNPGDKPGDRNV